MLDATCKDDVIRWDHYNQEVICNRFSIEEWHKMVGDIDTETEWQHFVSEYSDFVKCYILRKIGCNEAVAFVYLYKESITNKVVSIHGGGWDKSMHLSLLYYRGMIVMIEHLLNNGVKVRTSCSIKNTIAYRFLHSIGFVKYYASNTHIHMWINEKRLKNSLVYKRFR